MLPATEPKFILRSLCIRRALNFYPSDATLTLTLTPPYIIYIQVYTCTQVCTYTYEIYVFTLKQHPPLKLPLKRTSTIKHEKRADLPFDKGTLNAGCRYIPTLPIHLHRNTCGCRYNGDSMFIGDAANPGFYVLSWVGSRMAFRWLLGTSVSPQRSSQASITDTSMIVT